MEVIEWWLRPVAWVFARRPDWRDAFGRIVMWIGNRFYIALALILGCTGAWDQFVQPFSAQLSHANFDWLMMHRPIPYRPDPNIVVLDIDEASLGALAPQFGRWPWPRQVLSEVASRLEAAGAQAVLFDILFSDFDLASKGGDEAFDRYAADSKNSFYPFVRLNPKNDAVSQVPLSMLNFVSPDPTAHGKSDPKHTLALLPPRFASITDSGRLGTNNIQPDSDNVVRWYDNYERLAGYRIPSLAYRMAQLLHWPLPSQPRSLLNWPRGVAPYSTVSYADAYKAAAGGDSGYFARFAGKVVLIGATAPTLNDIKATPVDSMHPGIYVIAVAVDNMKNDRFLKTLGPAWIWLLEVLMLAAGARLFIRATRVTAVTKYFFIIPGSLLVISLLSVSVSRMLVDLSLPAALILSFFAFAKIFETNRRDFMCGTGVFAPTQTERTEGQLQIACLPASVPKETVQALLRQPGTPIKMWDPPHVGLGLPWSAQGWILWRWLLDRSRADTSGLEWQDALPATTGNPFTMAQSIAAAGRTARDNSNPEST